MAAILRESAGGIVGALAVGLWLLPACGLCRSWLILGALPAFAALPSTLREKQRCTSILLALMLATCLIMWWRGTGSDAKHGPRVLQSRQGQVEIREADNQRILLLDGLPQTAMPAEVAPGQALRHGYLLELAVGLCRPRNALVIGLGGGLAPRVLAAQGIRCEAVELDALVAELARSEFGCGCPLTVADGRAFLARTQETWDLIFLDVCTSERLAWHLFTVEGLQRVRSRLNPCGMVAMQFIGGDGAWPASVARTVETGFGHRALLEAPNPLMPFGPKWILAAASASSGLLLDRLKEPGAPWTVRPWPRDGDLLTDDRFPTEWAWSRTAQRWRWTFGSR